jgi:SAM-dependent methyltransferase
MSSYLGRHAELYDLLYEDKPYAEEAGFVHSRLSRYGAPGRRLLELACGTGSHALNFERLGYSVVATDYSKDMLDVATRKGREASSSVRFEYGDMTALDLGAGRFDAAVCLFDAIGYVRTNEALGRVFSGVARHLRPNGLFVFEFWHAAAMLRGYDPVRVRRWETPAGEVLRVSETTLDVAHQLSHVRYTILELGRDGRYARLEETQTNRYFLAQEMAALLSAGGLTPVAWYAGFRDDEIVTTDTWHVVAVARRGADEPPVSPR